MAVSRPAAAIIAGGAAVRLAHVSKPTLEVGGLTIAERQLAVLRPAFDRVIVVANDAGPWARHEVEVVPDRRAGHGPLSGIHAALVATADAPGVVCVAGDLPFLAPALLLALRDRAPDAVALAPRRGGLPEPLCARYGRAALPLVEARLEAGLLALHDLLDAAGAAWLEGGDLAALDPDGRSLFNINTPDDLRRARALAVAPR